MRNMCYHPWVGLNVTTQGGFRPCCKYQPSVESTEDNIVSSLIDYQNSQELTELKNAFLRDERPHNCQRCWDDEDADLPSKRQMDWQFLFQSVAPDLDSIKVLTLSFGNSCNLACITCDSGASSSWINEAKKLQQHFPTIKIHKHQKFYQDIEFINQIKTLSDNLIHIEFPGGEPFIAGIDEHLDYLDYLIAHNSKNISLHYMTNATVFPDEKFWSRWDKFKKIEIQLSIDGTDQRFNYIRWPGEWNSVENNLKSYISKKSETIQISIGHTVSIFNIFYLPEFVKWCLQNDLGRPYLGLVSDPKVYSIKVLPKQVKEILGKKLDRFNFKEIVSYMNSEDISENFDDTVKYIRTVDHQRDQDFNKTFPEFYNILKDAGCQI